MKNDKYHSLHFFQLLIFFQKEGKKKGRKKSKRKKERK